MSAWVAELLGTWAQVPAEWGLETSGPCSRCRCGDGSAIGAKAGPPWGMGPQGLRWCWHGGWMALEPFETLLLLPPGAQATLVSYLTY